jgi:hypothetical protein
MYTRFQKYYMALNKHLVLGRYERLRDFLVSKGFKVGKVDTTLFTKKTEDVLFIC